MLSALLGLLPSAPARGRFQLLISPALGWACSVAIIPLLPPPRGTGAALGDEHRPLSSPGPRALQVLRAFPLLSCFPVALLKLLQPAGSGRSAGRIWFLFSPFG